MSLLPIDFEFMCVFTGVYVYGVITINSRWNCGIKNCRWMIIWTENTGMYKSMSNIYSR